jgi:hypothetical protein
MASNKRPHSDDEGSTVVGYVHDVTETTLSQNKPTKYFKAIIQSELDYKEVVCFSPEKRRDFVTAASQK